MLYPDLLLKDISSNSLSISTLDLSGNSQVPSFEPTCSSAFSKHQGAVTALAWLSGGRLASGSKDKTICIWDLKTGTAIFILSGHENEITALIVLQDGRLASGSKDKTIGIWDTKIGKLDATLKGHHGWITALAVLQDGRLVSGSYDKDIYIWDAKFNNPFSILKGHRDRITALIVLQDGRPVSASYDKTIRIWDLKSGLSISVLEGHSDHIIALTVLKDGNFASGSADCTICIWNSKLGSLSSTLCGHGDYVMSLAGLQDRRLVSGSYQEIRVWDLSLSPVRSPILLKGLKDHVISLVALPEGGFISGSADSVIRVWNTSRRLESRDIDDLLIALKDNHSVANLILKDLTLHETSLRLLFDLIKTTKTMTSLNLTNTGINDEKAKLLLNALQENTSITECLLANNPINDRLSAVIKSETIKHACGGTRLSSSLISCEIDYNDLIRGRVLGEGGFGIVYEGKWKDKSVAIKELLVKQIPEKTRAEFFQEIEIMIRLKHSNIIILFGVCLKPGHYSMVMELMPGGSLHNYLSEKDNNIDWKTKLQLALDIGEGLIYLHSQHIFHRDLKSLNILLDDHLRAKISDFGLSAVKVETAVSTSKLSSRASKASKEIQLVGTIRWNAPEQFKRGFKYTDRTDVYSYGVVLWEIATQKIPYADTHNETEVIHYITTGQTEDIPETCLPKYAEAIKSCWISEPEKRPSAIKVVEQLKSFGMFGDKKVLARENEEITAGLEKMKISSVKKN